MFFDKIAVLWSFFALNREQINKYDNKFQNYLFVEFKRLFIIELICKYMTGLSNRQKKI